RAPRAAVAAFLRVSIPCSEIVQVALTLAGHLALIERRLPFSVAGPTRLDERIRLSRRALETPPAPPALPLPKLPPSSPAPPLPPLAPLPPFAPSLPPGVEGA